jgi:predicted component of type VI protein secretion system
VSGAFEQRVKLAVAEELARIEGELQSHLTYHHIDDEPPVLRLDNKCCDRLDQLLRLNFLSWGVP